MPSNHEEIGLSGVAAVLAPQQHDLEALAAAGLLTSSPAVLSEFGFERAHICDARNPPEDLMQVNLGAPRLGILAVLPVHQEDPQSDPPQFAGERVQHTVHEPGAGVGSETFRQVNGFLDHGDRGRVADP